MGADISRVRFDARNDYNGVVIQQGRVRLDADDNEQSAITDRRLRAQTADLGSFGLADVGVAVIPRTTPNAFKLALVGGKLTIGRGRIYVDGILAENHGTGAQYDPLLGELTGNTDTTYDAQPYLPSPPALPTKGTHLIYLDVWERELTADERPLLVEPALGVDTTARTQVAWQVRAHLPDSPGIDCSTPSASIPGWSDLIAPPTARLTVGTQPVAPDDDPCSLPPAGGYRGLENQSYRVEVHRPGAAGTATFTWSRDNGSVAVAVTEVVSATQLRLTSLGKDADFLGIKTGDWVEILDDAHELTGTPGELRHVTAHPEDLSISFDVPPPGTAGGTGPLPVGWPTTTAGAVAGHLRVRRWDGTDGETTIDAVPMPLEHGITVALTAGADGFRTGQYWIFAARTAIADVENLTDAPPTGPKHHYARLGVIDFSAGTVVSAQCPPLWPPDAGAACDTVTVCPDDHKSGHMTLQQAINQVATGGGGSVCLCAGTFSLDEPLRIAEAHGVWLRGQGVATVVQSHSDVVDIASSAAISITDMKLVSDNTTTTGAGASTAAVIRLDGTQTVALERLTLVASGATTAMGAAPVTSPAGSAGVALQGNVFDTRIRDCEVSADLCVTTIAGDGGATVETLEISGSTLTSSAAGVHLEGVTLSGAVRVSDNVVVGGTVGLNLIASAVAADVTVYDNDISEAATGIAVADSGYNVARNTITAPSLKSYDGAANATDATTTTTTTAAGIVARTNPGSAERETRVTGNSVTGFPVGILVESTAPVIVIDDNQISGSQMAGIAATGGGASTVNVADVAQQLTACRVQNNVISQIGSAQSASGISAGIYAIGFQTVDISRNLVTTVGVPEAVQIVAGALVFATTTAIVAGNTFRDVGASPKDQEAADILLAGVSSLTVVDNVSAREGRYVEVDTIGLVITDGSFVGHAMAGLHAKVGSRPIESYVSKGAGADFGHQRTATVTGNTLIGGPSSPAMSAQIRGVALVADNHFARSRRGGDATARLHAISLAFTGNHAAGRDFSAMLTSDRTDSYTVLGNLTEGDIEINGAVLAGAWAPLNVTGVV